jgi:murein DD-endopeptidase MepM/ murein hydrolase activator NlpD
MTLVSDLRRVLLLTLASTLSTAATAEVLVPPGGVVRWPGADIDRCGQADRVWDAVAGACWYPIDLLELEGKIELSRWRSGQQEIATVTVSAYPYEVQHITLKDDSQVNLSSADLARVREENQRIGALWTLTTPCRFQLPLSAPLEGMPQGGRFGSRRFFNNQPRSPHTGADYPAKEGEPVLAVADGTVVLADDFFFSGGSVFLDHGAGLISMYFHLRELTVEQGDRVERGEVIGTVGQTGRATGPHLHMGLRWRGARIDPSVLLAPVEGIPTIP